LRRRKPFEREETAPRCGQFLGRVQHSTDLNELPGVRPSRDRRGRDGVFGGGVGSSGAHTRRASSVPGPSADRAAPSRQCASGQARHRSVAGVAGVAAYGSGLPYQLCLAPCRLNPPQRSFLDSHQKVSEVPEADINPHLRPGWTLPYWVVSFVRTLGHV
jgi:hypothetical protein